MSGVVGSERNGYDGYVNCVYKEKLVDRRKEDGSSCIQSPNLETKWISSLSSHLMTFQA